MAFKGADNAEKLGYVAGINFTLQVIFMNECVIDTNPSNCILDHLSKRNEFMFI